MEVSLDPDSLTLGFARRLATYKRLTSSNHDPERAQTLFAGDYPTQLVIAGKAHPNDEPGQGLAPAASTSSSTPTPRSRAGS